MRNRNILVKSCMLTILLSLTLGLTLNVSAADRELKVLSTVVSTAATQGEYEEIGMIYFFQKKETSVFGSDTALTLSAAIKNLEQMAKKLEADKVINLQIIPIAVGEPGLIVCSTAIKLRQ